MRGLKAIPPKRLPIRVGIFAPAVQSFVFQTWYSTLFATSRIVLSGLNNTFAPPVPRKVGSARPSGSDHSRRREHQAGGVPGHG